MSRCHLQYCQQLTVTKLQHLKVRLILLFIFVQSLLLASITSLSRALIYLIQFKAHCLSCTMPMWLGKLLGSQRTSHIHITGTFPPKALSSERCNKITLARNIYFKNKLFLLNNPSKIICIVTTLLLVILYKCGLYRFYALV